jgi:hypothetical protein
MTAAQRDRGRRRQFDGCNPHGNITPRGSIVGIQAQAQPAIRVRSKQATGEPRAQITPDLPAGSWGAHR